MGWVASRIGSQRETGHGNVLRGLHFACSTLEDPPSKKLRVGHPSFVKSFCKASKMAIRIAFHSRGKLTLRTRTYRVPRVIF
jgi:hypothetical protein